MLLIFQKIKNNGAKNSIKKIITLLYQKVRIFFYRLQSLNQPLLQNCKIYQPLYCLGKGKIKANKVSFGVTISPFFLNGYIYLDARAESASIEIGENTFINNNAVIIADRSSICIGKACLIGAHFSVMDSDFHGLEPQERFSENYKTKAVTVGDNVFIGNNVTITKGVTVGKNAVIGTGSIVTSDVPENTIYAGNPARFVRNLSTEF